MNIPIQTDAITTFPVEDCAEKAVWDIVNVDGSPLDPEVFIYYARVLNVYSRNTTTVGHYDLEIRARFEFTEEESYAILPFTVTVDDPCGRD